MKRVTELKEISREIWHNVLPVGEFHDPRYGKVKITKEMVTEMAENFKKGIPHYEPPINLSHKDELGAYGKVADLEAREDGLWAKLVLTDEGVELVRENKFRYVSAEFVEDYMDKKTGKSTGHVFLGVALTNRPAHPGVEPIKLMDRIKEAVKVLVEWLGLKEEEETIELAEVPGWPIDEDSSWNWNWARDAEEIINKFGWATLAKACAYVDTDNYEKGDSGYPEVKAAYKLPFAKIKGGRMTIYKRGVIAAMQALLGARGGTNIPSDKRKSVYNKLAALYRRMGMEPPEYHLEEVNGVLEEKLKTFEEKVKTLEEEKEELIKKLEEVEKEKKELEEKLIVKEVESWVESWIQKGVLPATMKKFKEIVLEEPNKMKVFDEVLETLAKPENMEQLGDSEDNPLKNMMEKADKIAKVVYGGDL